MADYMGKWSKKRSWIVKQVLDPTTAAGMRVGDALEFTGLGNGDPATSKLKRGNPDPTTDWGTSCRIDTNPEVDKITLSVGGQPYTITREVVVRLICKPNSGSISWTAEEGGP